MRLVRRAVVGAHVINHYVARVAEMRCDMLSFAAFRVLMAALVPVAGSTAGATVGRHMLVHVASVMQVAAGRSCIRRRPVRRGRRVEKRCRGRDPRWRSLRRSGHPVRVS